MTDTSPIVTDLARVEGVRSAGYDDELESYYVDGTREATHTGIDRDLPEWADATSSSDAGAGDLRVYVDVNEERWEEIDSRRSALIEAVLEVTGTGYMGKYRRESYARRRWPGRYVVRGPFARDLDVDDLDGSLPEWAELHRADDSGTHGEVVVSATDD